MEMSKGRRDQTMWTLGTVSERHTHTHTSTHSTVTVAARHSTTQHSPALRSKAQSKLSPSLDNDTTAVCCVCVYLYVSFLKLDLLAMKPLPIIFVIFLPQA